MTCPFTGDQLVLVPALKPDIAILHAHYADQHGNLHIEARRCRYSFCQSVCKSHRAVEEIIPHEELRKKA